MLPVVLALFAVYVAAVTWQMRRAMRAGKPARRRREAVRLLLLVSLGAPMAAVLILVSL